LNNSTLASSRNYVNYSNNSNSNNNSTIYNTSINPSLTSKINKNY